MKEKCKKTKKRTRGGGGGGAESIVKGQELPDVVVHLS